MTSDSLWLDSSVIRAKQRVLAPLVELARSRGLNVLVHAHIHMEMCRHHRESKGERYSQPLIDTWLNQMGIVVADFHLTKQTAEECAAMLHRRYPTSEAWKAAKLSSVRARLTTEATLKEEKVPMTTDWWVALEVERLNGYIAVEDKGDEWSALRLMKPCRALSYDACMDWLRDRDSNL